MPGMLEGLEARRARQMVPGLAPDPLAAAERLVAQNLQRETAGAGQDGSEG
jgi:hypothetical protein